MNIEQIRSGANSLVNLYAPLPQQGYIVPFYVFLGFCARIFGLSALAMNSLARPIVTVIAFCLLYRVSQRVVDSKENAIWVLFAVTCFGGCGWIVSTLYSYLGWTFSFPIADIGSEAFFFPIAFAGPHIILSFALLVFSIEGLWDQLTGDGSRQIWPIFLSSLFLLWIHPYFGLLLAIIGFIGLIVGHRRKRLQWMRAVFLILAGILGLLPHVLAHIQNETRRFAVLENHLPLGHWWVWLIACLPWVLGLLWRLHLKIAFKKSEEWLLAWLAAIPIALLMPFFWKRKLLEGFGALLIWLCVPVFLSLVKRLRSMGLFYSLAFCLWLMLSPLSFVLSQIAWMDGSRGRATDLIVSQDLQYAWAWMRQNTESTDMVLTDHVWIGTWTPTYGLRPVWIGHDFETPDWEKKNRELQELFFDGSMERARVLLNRIQPQLVLTTEKTKTERFSRFFSGEWEPVKRFGLVEIWKKKKL